MRKTKFLWVIVLALILNAATIIQAQPQTQATPRDTSQVEKEYEFLKKLLEDQQAFFKEQMKEYREETGRAYDRLVKIIELFALALTIMFAILGFSAWKMVPAYLKQLFEKEAITIIDSRNRKIQVGYASLENIVARETEYLDKSILFVASEPDQKRLRTVEIPILRSRGIQSIEVTAENVEAIRRLERKACDLIAYYYNPPQPDPQQTGDTQMVDLVKYLDREKAKIPFVAYTYGKGIANQIYKYDYEKLPAYPYFVPANYPISLVNLINTVAHYFPIAK